jgi:hypothetical protein
MIEMPMEEEMQDWSREGWEVMSNGVGDWGEFWVVVVCLIG